jgi:orotidine-5'-phosphate decarboxylase
VKAPIILAVDTSDLDIARAWIEATRESVSMYKLGLEFYLSHGFEGIKKISQESGAEIFLDLKLHDIPKTVSSAAQAVSALEPRFLTVHASGGRAMIEAAVKAVPHIEITAVTILTSLSEHDLFEIGLASPALESAVALAKLAVDAGAKAIVCSPLEIEAIRLVVGVSPTIITPGVRPASSQSDALKNDDQARTMTPRQAMDAGATFVVIGRPITQAWSKGSLAMTHAAREIADEILN